MDKTGKQIILNCEKLERRFALLNNGRLEEYQIERDGNEPKVGDIYLGKIINLEPSLQAAFVVMRACEQRTTTVRTAYDALVSGTGDSCALAMAYKAVCDALNIPCQVVSGRFQGIDRCWNVVQVNGNYYHLDLSMQSETLWLRSDESMRGPYQWTADSCPTCAAQSFIWREGEKL